MKSNNKIINPLARIPQATPVGKLRMGTSPRWGSRSQSILEYLIILAAIIIAILANTIGLKTGVQNSLDTIQNTTAAQMSSAAAPKTVQGENYYTAPKQTTSSPDWNGTDTYGGPNYTGGYNYDEWVKNNPNSAYNAPAAGTVLQTGDNSGGTNAKK